MEKDILSFNFQKDEIFNLKIDSISSIKLNLKISRIFNSLTEVVTFLRRIGTIFRVILKNYIKHIN